MAAAAAAAGTSSGFTATAFAAGSGGGSFGSAVASGDGNGSAGGSKAGGNPFLGLSLFSSPGAGRNLFAAVGAASTQDTITSGSTVASANVAGATAVTAANANSSTTDPQDAAAESDQDSGEEPLAEGETGEEDEEVVFRGECKLTKLVQATSVDGNVDANEKKSAGGGSTDASEKAAAETLGQTQDVDTKRAEESKSWRWQERGCGIIHINRHSKTGAGRLVMRMRGVGKLLLNTPVFPTGKYERVGQKSLRFIGVDVDGEAAVEGGESPNRVSLCSYRVTLQSGEQQSNFLAALRSELSLTV